MPVEAAAFIFDCDGVLVDSERIASKIDVAELAAHGIPITAEILAGRFSGLSYRDMHAILEAESGVRLPEDFARNTYRLVLAALAAESATLAIPGIHRLLDALEGCRKCVASSSSPEWLATVLRPAGLWQRFEPHIFSRVQVQRGKPAPDLFLLAAGRLQVDPADCLVIEDSLVGVQAARAAGMRVFGFCGGGHCGPGHADRLLAEGAAAAFQDMESLQAALCGP